MSSCRQSIPGFLPVFRFYLPKAEADFIERSETSRSGLSSLCVAFEELVDSAFHKQHSITWYADQLACTTRTLARVVRQARGLSPKEFVDARTVLEAKRLLAHRDEKIAVLAEELGFLETTHFGRFFLRVAGETPAAFRKRWRDDLFGE